MGVGRVAVLGTLGRDGFGYELRRGLEDRGIDSNLLVESPTLQTFTYTKLINGSSGEEDLPRVDFINNSLLDAETERCVIDVLKQSISAFDVILISDQAETLKGGVVTAAVREALFELAQQRIEKVFIADSRTRAEEFRHVIIKPNRQEADAACIKLFSARSTMLAC